jgi:hypothetical protein
MLRCYSDLAKSTESTSNKRKYDSAIDTSCAFETNDLNLTTANFDSYGNDVKKIPI